MDVGFHFLHELIERYGVWAGFMHYKMPIIPDSVETFKEGLFGALTVAVVPFCIFYVLNKVMPVFKETH